MSSAPSLTEVREVFEALGPPGTPFTTTEVATRFECTDRTIYNRLETLVEDGVLETKKVGARGRVWWRPVGRDGENERNTEETYQKLFESINEGLCIIEVLFDADEQPVDYRFLETNPAFDELTGLGDAAGKRIRELDVDHSDNRVQKYGAVARTGEPVQFTEYAEHLGEQWYEINAFRIGDPTEHTVAVLFDDITENKHAENAVDEGEKRLEALLEATTEGVYRISPDWSEIYQLAGEDFISHDPPNTWQEYIPDDDRERVGEAIEEAIETRSPFELEHRITRADGTIGWVDSRAVPIVEGGEIVEWIGTATDITERKERESRIERYKLYLQSAPDLVTVLDEDGIIRYDSPGVSDMLGYDTKERIGDSGFDYVHPDDRDRIRERFRSLAGEDVSRSKEYRARTKDGDWIWLESRTRIPAEDHPLDDIVVTARDITKRKEQQRKRQEVIDRVTDGIIELDADWQCQFVSGQGGALLNISESELLNRNFWDVFEDARGTPFETQYRAVMHTRESASFVEYYPPLEGWFDVQAYPNDDGGVAIYFRDVTERKEQQKARKRAETRYQKLLELAPVPIFAVDPTTEEILEVNEAAGELIGCPVDDLIGRTRASVHPNENSDGYDTIFKKATERGGTWRHLPDGSPTYIVTEDGEKNPVEITGKKIELRGDDVVYGVLQDISDQLEYQRRLRNLNEVTHELFEAETEREVTQTAVEALADILERSTVSFYSFNEDEWKLEPVVHTTSSEEAEEIDQIPAFEPGVGVEWHAFADGQTTIVDDFQNRETEYEFNRTIRSELAVPIADWGVLVVGDTRPDIFDDWTANLVETLGATLSSALDHTEREQELREQRRELREIESLNQQIRDITHTIVRADSRVELEQSVCEQLIESDTIEFAWIGNVDLENKAVTPRAQAGAGDTYLDNVSLRLDRNTDSEPSVQALQSRDVCGSSNVPTNIQHSDWRSMAVEQGFRSVLSVPLVYREALYGTLTVYSQTTSGFPDALEAVLQELCNLIAHATAAIEQKEALQTTRTAELEFEVRDEETLFCRFATVLNCEIELERIVPQKGESTLAFFSVADGTLEKLPEEANRLDGIEEGHLIKRANDTLIQLRITEPCIASVLSDRGLLLRRLFADSTQCRLTVEVPKSFDPRQAVNIIMSQYEDVQLLAKHESDTSSDPSLDTMLDALTPRQREVVETAYRVGYFDSPRRVSGKDVAEMFDFSNSTFHEHIRKAEQTLFENLIEDTSSPLVG